MSALTTWIPRLINGIGVIHLAYGLAVPAGRKAAGEIAAAGFVNSVNGRPERESWFWYMLSGVALLALGELARWTVRETGRIPARLGAWLLAIAVPITVTMPASGGWLVAAAGALALRAARTDRPSRNAVQTPPHAAVRACSARAVQLRTHRGSA